MTENEMLKIAIHCLSVQAEQEVCEECDIYGNCHTDCKDVAVAAIKALEEIQQYRAIGDVEECREAVEKQKAKKCVIDFCPDHTHYKCPSCGKIHLSIYKCGCLILGSIPRFCEYCGQALIDNDLEGMEDAVSED